MMEMLSEQAWQLMSESELDWILPKKELPDAENRNIAG